MTGVDSSSVLWSQLRWLLSSPGRCFPVTGVAADFPASLIPFHPFPEAPAGCSSRALGYSLLRDPQERRWARAPLTSAFEARLEEGLEELQHLPLASCQAAITLVPNAFAGGGKSTGSESAVGLLQLSPAVAWLVSAQLRAVGG